MQRFGAEHKKASVILSSIGRMRRSGLAVSPATADVALRYGRSDLRSTAEREDAPRTAGWDHEEVAGSISNSLTSVVLLLNVILFGNVLSPFRGLIAAQEVPKALDLAQQLQGLGVVLKPATLAALKECSATPGTVQCLHQFGLLKKEVQALGSNVARSGVQEAAACGPSPIISSDASFGVAHSQVMDHPSNSMTGHMCTR